MEQQPEQQLEQPPIQKKGRKGLIIIIVCVLLLGSGVAVYFLFNNQLIRGKTPIPEEIVADTSLLNLAPLSEEEERKISLFRAVRIHRDTIRKKFPLLTKMDEDDSVFEIDSYKTKALLNRDINKLQEVLTELDMMETALSEVDEETREEIRNSNLSEEGKTIAMEGFNKLASDPERSSLTLKRYQALRDVYQEWLQMHQFLLANFNDYLIASGDDGQKSIFFYSDGGLAKYNANIDETRAASQRYLDASQVLEEQITEALMKQGIDAESQEFIDAVYN
jgi:hypothetical protein